MHQRLPPSCRKTTHHILKNTIRRTLNASVAAKVAGDLVTSPKPLPYFTGKPNPHPTLLPPFENQASRYYCPSKCLKIFMLFFNTIMISYTLLKQLTIEDRKTGWIQEERQRQNGHRDKYYYHLKSEEECRSLLEVYDFIKLGVPKRLRKKLNINEGKASPSKEKRSGASLLSKKIVGSYNNETKMVSLQADVERQPEQVHNVASAHNEAEASRGTYSSAFKLGPSKDVFQLLLYNIILSSYRFIFQLLQVINMSSHTLPSSFFECVRRFAG
ncbi:hypothetical protein RHSIM_Rhsim12G0007600 [Rhododendron simsii]|uniref:Uncharacterized protein n=1 Tax=Rhododendron simsii TaxID=118357 RepID=A0A834G5U2_RHOSS|nr:hypothetical protein RHSIM_Rhsim12G0007600 [Rhododendron simsii]